MYTISDKLLLEKISNGDQFSWDLLYKRCFPMIALYISQNSGNREDAEDIFQEAVIVLYQKVKSPDFVLTSSLSTYVFAISKNLWLKSLRVKQPLFVDEWRNYQGEVNMLVDEQELGIQDEGKLQTWLSKITQNCQRILKALFFYNIPLENLMVKMGWKNKHTASNQKYKCIQQLKKEVQKEIE